MALLLATVILSCTVIVPVVAKYRATDKKREIAYANSFYFESDYLSELNADGVTGGAEYVIQGWDGVTTCDFAFQIRNYENPMLYNNATQNISYEVSSSTTYGDYIEYTIEKVVNHEASPLLEGTLNGGAACADIFKITVKPKAGVTINNDVSIKITAKTKEGSPYIKNIGTTLILKRAESSNFISDKGFENPKSESCALKYVLHTTSGVMDNGHTSITNAAKLLHITWNNALVSIDEYNPLLLAVKEADLTREEANKRFYYTDGGATGHLIIEVLPYTAVNIIFYKDTMVESDWMSGGAYLWDTNEESIVNTVEVQP